jgi:hypothetical protein
MRWIRASDSALSMSVKGLLRYPMVFVIAPSSYERRALEALCAGEFECASSMIPLIPSITIASIYFIFYVTVYFSMLM